MASKRLLLLVVDVAGVIGHGRPRFGMKIGSGEGCVEDGVAIRRSVG